MRVLTLSFLIPFGVFAQSKMDEPSRKHFWHTVTTSASPETVWTIWTDVSNWHTWDTGLQSARMDDAFRLEAKGVLTSLEGRDTKFTVVAYEEGSSYTFKSALPLGGLYVKRTLSEEDGKTVFTHEVWFQVLTAGIFARAFGDNFRAMLPEVMETVKAQAETKDKP
ncbi:MAG TPA: polyketide cyclase [Cytophagales bacterium]|nr:polyketide cyclase [Cytophagales bacterium]